MAGKNKVELGFRIWLDDDGGTPRDLTPSLVPGTCVGGGDTHEKVDLTAANDNTKNYLRGHAEAEISAQFYMDDTATTGSHTVIESVNGAAGTLTMQWGSSGAAPAAGDPEWEGEYLCLGGPVSMSGGRAVRQVTFVPGSSVAPAFGTVS